MSAIIQLVFQVYFFIDVARQPFYLPPYNISQYDSEVLVRIVSY